MKKILNDIALFFTAALSVASVCAAFTFVERLTTRYSLWLRVVPGLWVFVFGGLAWLIWKANKKWFSNLNSVVGADGEVPIPIGSEHISADHAAGKASGIPLLKGSILYWCFWWRADDAAIAEEAAAYESLSPMRSSKSIGGLLLLVGMFGNVELARIVRFDLSVWDLRHFVDYIVAFALAGVIASGNRWGMIGGMFFWTYERLFNTIQTTRLTFFGLHAETVNCLVGLTSWCIMLHVLSFAFKVEQQRRRGHLSLPPQPPSSVQFGLFANLLFVVVVASGIIFKLISDVGGLSLMGSRANYGQVPIDLSVAGVLLVIGIWSLIKSPDRNRIIRSLAIIAFAFIYPFIYSGAFFYFDPPPKRFLGPHPQPSLEDLQSSAAKGDIQAELQIGYLYENGRKGVSKSYVDAMTWFRKAAEQGNSEAQNDVGLLYQNGWGVEKDNKMAAGWFQKAIDQGYEPAKYNLCTITNPPSVDKVTHVRRDPCWLMPIQTETTQNLTHYLPRILSTLGCFLPGIISLWWLPTDRRTKPIVTTLFGLVYIAVMVVPLFVFNLIVACGFFGACP